MAIIKCFECNNEFSDYAKACPKCGCPTNIVIINQKKDNNSNGETPKVIESENSQLLDNNTNKQKQDEFSINMQETVKQHKNKGTKNIVILIISIPLLLLLYYFYNHNQILNEAKNWHDGDGYTIEEQVNDWMRFDGETSMIYGWTAKRIDSDTYFIAFEFDDDKTKDNGFVMYIFEYNRGIKLVRNIVGNYSLEKKYRELGLIE